MRNIFPERLFVLFFRNTASKSAITRYFYSVCSWDFFKECNLSIDSALLFSGGIERDQCHKLGLSFVT